MKKIKFIFSLLIMLLILIMLIILVMHKINDLINLSKISNKDIIVDVLNYDFNENIRNGYLVHNDGTIYFYDEKAKIVNKIEKTISIERIKEITDLIEKVDESEYISFPTNTMVTDGTAISVYDKEHNKIILQDSYASFNTSEAATNIREILRNSGIIDERNEFLDITSVNF